MRHFYNVRDRRQIVHVEQAIIRSNVWDGGGANDNWFTPENWVSVQSPEAGDTLHFAGTVRTEPVNNYPIDIKFQSIVFDSGNPGFVLTGTRFELLGSMIQNDDSNQEVLMDMKVNNAVSIALVAGNIEFGGDIVGTGSITISGNSPYRFLSNLHVTFAGAVTILDNVYARLIYGDGLGSGQITLNGGGIRNNSTSITVTNNIVLGANHGHITASNADVVTFDGIISGVGELHVNWDNGIAVVNGLNTYTGKTVVGDDGPGAGSAANTLRFNSLANGGANCALGAGSVIEVGQAGVSRNVTLEYVGAGDSTDRTFSLVGSGGTIKISNNGSGTLTLTRAAPFTVADGSKTLEVDGANTILITGAVANPTSGTLSLTKSGAGTTILSGANTYTDNTTISSGTLQIGNGGTTGALSTSSAISNNGTLVFNRSNTITGGTNFHTLISGSGGVTQNGSGTLAFVGTQTYTGPTTINAGKLQLGNNSSTGALSTSSAIVNNGILAIRRTNSVTQGTDFNSVISGTGSVLHNPSSNYTLTLNGVNTFGGGVSMTAGTLVVSTSNDALGTGTLTIGTAVTRVIVNDGLTIANNIIFNTGAGSGANGRGVLENSGAGNATVNGTITVNGAIANGGHFASVSTGTLTLMGAITSSSTTIIQRLGTVIYGGGGSYANLSVTSSTARLGATNGLATNATIALLTANLDLNGYNQSLVGVTQGTTAIVGNSSTSTDSTLTLTGTPTWAGVIKDVLGSGTRKVNVTINSSGTVIFTGTNTYTGVTTISGGTLQLGSNGTTGTILNCPSIVNNSALIFHTSNDQLYSSTIISGSGTVTKRGATSAVTLYGVNTYTGATYVEEGTLQIGNTLVDGSINNSASISVSSGGVLTFSPVSSGGTYPNVISGDGQVFKAGAGTMIFTGNNTYTGLTTVIAGTLQVGDNTTTGAIAGNIKVDTALIFYRSNLYAYAGVLSGSGTIEKKGTSWLRLIGGASTFNGTVTVTAGQLHFGDGSGNNGTMVDCTIVNNSEVHFSLISTTVTHNGNISGSGSLTKSGNSSTVVLAGTCTYSGTTLVNAGVLRLTGSISNSNVAVSGLSTLEGPTTTGASATISNQVQVQNTGTIRPGAFGNNTLNVGPLYFDAGAIMIADSTTTTFSKIAATGDVTFGGGSIDFPAGITTDGTYKLITSAGTMSGTLPSVGTNSTGKTLTLQQTGNDLEVVVS